MWRALFIALGIVMIVVGIEFLVIDSATLAGGGGGAVEKPQSKNFFFNSAPPPKVTQKVFKPKEWQAWSLLASGAIVVIYAKTLRRGGGAPAG